jgi:hypothetical protein
VTTPAEVEWILPTRRNLIAGGAAFVTGLAVGGFGASLGLDPAVPADARAGAGVLSAVVMAAFLAAGAQLVRYRGGIALDRAGSRLGFRLTSPTDTWWVPLDRVVGIARRSCLIVRGDTPSRLWSAEIVLRGTPPVLVTESDDEPSVREVQEMLIRSSGLPEVEPTPAEPETAPIGPGEVHFGVRVGAALQPTLFLLGMGLVVMGVALMMRMRVEIAVGLFVAPVMALVGLSFAGVAVGKRLATEELRHAQGVWRHQYRCGPFTWGVRSVNAKRPTWRLQMLALRGANLELVGDDGILLLGGGATTRSRASLQALASLPDQFRASGL